MPRAVGVGIQIALGANVCPVARAYRLRSVVALAAVPRACTAQVVHHEDALAQPCVLDSGAIMPVSSRRGESDRGSTNARFHRRLYLIVDGHSPGQATSPDETKWQQAERRKQRPDSRSGERAGASWRRLTGEDRTDDGQDRGTGEGHK